MYAMHRPSILYTEDHHDTRESLSWILRSYGFDVTEAATGQEALAAVGASHHELVLLDVRLPDLSGFEVCRRLRSAPATARTPVLFLSGSVSQPAQQVEGLYAGADGFLVKPIDPSLLAAHIRALLRGRRAGAMLALQSAALERVVAGEPLSRTLDGLARGVEALAPGMRCSVLLLSEDGKRLRTAAAPSLPEAYSASIDGVAIGPAVGSCGTAAFRRERVAVEDIATDPLWADYRYLALGHGLRACWSTPVLGRDGRVLATFACYYTAPRSPMSDELALIDAATHLTAVVVERARDEEARTRLEAEYRQAQKMEAVGRLAGGVAHDMNNLLTVVLGCGEMALDALDADHPAQALVAEVLAAARRAAELTKQLLAFGRKQVVRYQTLDLNLVVREAARMLGRVLGEDVHLTVESGPDPVWVRADHGQLEQVIMNLAVNARDAMPTGGELTLSADVRGAEAVLSVTDTGCGMTEEVRARMFDPFFTTKGSGKGTGLGLAVVHSIVEQAGGRVEVDSALGRGTAVRVVLPAALRSASATDPVHELPTPSGTERVLVVEDDAMVRSLVIRALTAIGYSVTSAKDAEEAARVVSSAPSFELLVTDVVMPGASGRELADRVRAVRPGLRVLYMSGFTDDEVVRHGVREEKAHFIHKPFTPAQLGRKVREVLDAADLSAQPPEFS